MKHAKIEVLFFDEYHEITKEDTDRFKKNCFKPVQKSDQSKHCQSTGPDVPPSDT